MQLAYEYYEGNKTGLGKRFLNVLDYYFDRIQKYPEHYQIKTKPYREAVIKDFPFVLIYEIEETRVIVYAVFNTWKNPKTKPIKKK